MRKLLSLLFILSTSTSFFSQNKLKAEIYDAFVSGDITKWDALTTNFEKQANLNSETDLLKLIHCYYGYTSLLISRDEDKKAKENIKRAEEYINRVLLLSPNNALALNYKGTFMSYRISISKLKAISLGKPSIRCINKALSLEPSNPQILFDKGNSLYYPPKLFGGDKKEAIKYFQKAIAIIEQNNETAQNWIYLQMLFLQARAHELTDNLTQAKQGYEKVMRVEPNFRIVRNKYYPELLEKLK